MSGTLLAQSKLPAVDYEFFFRDAGAIVRYAFAVKSRLVIDTVFEQFGFFVLPFLQLIPCHDFSHKRTAFRV